MKRRIDEFGVMISTTTDRNPMDFNGYGNWCGLGGSGDTVDAIDECCQVHDGCYAHVNRDECKTLLKYKVYTKKYRWQMHQGEITCRDEDICPKSICECDKAAAICFGENKHVYDQANKHSGITQGISNSLKKIMG